MTDTPDTRTTEERRGEETDGPEPGVVRRDFDPDGDRDLTTEILGAVAEAEGVSPTELRSPLYRSIDVESLEAVLFGHPGETEGGQRGGTVEFDYTGHHVTVTAEGKIEVSGADAGASH